MSPGTLYGIGLGPGDPELVTVKACRLLGRLPNLFAPKATDASSSIARGIASRYVPPGVVVQELVYPMTRDHEVLAIRWRAAAAPIVELLRRGEDVGFLTLGDPLLYSTCIYLIRAVRDSLPATKIEVVPAVTSISASAALAEFVLGESDSLLTIVPAPDDDRALDELAERGGRLVLLKAGARWPALARWLTRRGWLERARLVVRAGLEGERVLTDLRQKLPVEVLGYLTTLLIDLDAVQSTTSSRPER